MKDGRPAPHDGMTIALGRLSNRRAHRDRAVYVAAPLRHSPIGDPPSEPNNSTRANFVALSRHEPFSPLAGTLLRPFGDAAVAIQTLLRRG